MYSPREDSELLWIAAEKTIVETKKEKRTHNSKITFCDIGTGSGYLAQNASQLNCDVTAIEKDASAIKEIKKNNLNKKTNYKLIEASSILEIKNKFDIIVCNPPYLPNDDEVFDMALHGGKKGYEYIVKVIQEVKERMKPNAKFLFLISTLTKPSVVEKALLENGYEYEIIAREKLFMEELLVYKATLVLGQSAQLIGEGWRSRVYAINKGRVAVKVTTVARAIKEEKILRKVNKIGIGPRIIKREENKIYMKRIFGTPLDEHFGKNKDKNVLRQALNQAYKLDVLGLRKQELTRPNANVLVTEKGKVVLIDFERSIYSNKNNNVNQLAAWASKILKINAIEESKNYAKKPNKNNFEKILSALKI